MIKYTTTGPRTKKAAQQLIASAVAAWLKHTPLDELFDDRGMTDVQWTRLSNASDELVAHLQKRAGET
jgi:hypothetical protein